MNDMFQTEQTALAVLPAAALPTILANDKNDILGKLAAKVAAFRPDISTAKGRDEMRSLAYEIAKAKTSLVKIGKGLTEEWRASTKAVNAECDTIEERLNELRDKVRAPLTAWENAEKDRVAAHETALAEVIAWATVPGDWAPYQIAHHLEVIASHPHQSRDWQEFTERATAAMEAAYEATRRAHAVALKREAEAVELARLREAEAKRERERQEQERIAREARIAAEAAQKAKREAEAKAAEEAAAAERRAQAERDAAAKRERDAADALARAEREKAAAEQRAVEAAAKAERDRAAAVEAERRRIEDQVAAQRKADELRAANIAHRSSINREILAAIVLAMSDAHSGTAAEAEAIGKTIVAAIANGKVPHVKVMY